MKKKEVNKLYILICEIIPYARITWNYWIWKIMWLKEFIYCFSMWRKRKIVVFNWMFIKYHCKMQITSRFDTNIDLANVSSVVLWGHWAAGWRMGWAKHVDVRRIFCGEPSREVARATKFFCFFLLHLHSHPLPIESNWKHCEILFHFDRLNNCNRNYRLETCITKMFGAIVLYEIETKQKKKQNKKQNDCNLSIIFAWFSNNFLAQSKQCWTHPRRQKKMGKTFGCESKWKNWY